MNALRSVWRIPGVIAGLWITQVVITALFGATVASAVRVALARFSIPSDGHLLAYIAQLLAAHPAVAASIGTAVVGSAVMGLVLWTLVSGGIIARLAGQPGFWVVCGRWLPAMAVTSLWHFLLRAALLGIGVLCFGFLPRSVAIPILVGALAFFSCALDIARTHVVLHRARPFHIHTAAQGLVQAILHPRILLQSVGLSLVQWAFAGGALYVAMAGMDDGSGVIGARLLALGALLAGLSRLAVVVGAGPLSARRTG